MSHQALNDEQFGPYFHGTNQEFAPGAMLKGPGHEGQMTFNPPHATYSPHHVYYSTNRASAEGFAQTAALKRGGTPRVYEVHPHGEVEKDPETEGVSGWDFGYRATGAKIHREIPIRQ